MWPGGATVGYTKESLRELVEKGQVTTRIEIIVTKLDKPEIRHGLQHPFRVDVFETESTLANLRELFFFPALPAEIASSDEKIQIDWLADCVCDLLNRERQQFRAQALATRAHRLGLVSYLMPGPKK